MTTDASVQSDPLKARVLTSPWHAFGQKFSSLSVYGRPATYPVVNERAIRATAGIVMALAAIAISFAAFEQNYWPVRIISVFIAADYAVRQIAGLTPLSPIGTVATFLVNNQQPEWVGGSQKRFSWGVAGLMALSVAILTNLGVTGPFVVVLGGSFITLLWSESVLGFCVGCWVYSLLIKAGLIDPEDAEACAGNICQIGPGT